MWIRTFSTCVCEHPVGAKSHIVGQVGGKLLRSQSDALVVPVRRLLKQHDTVYHLHMHVRRIQSKTSWSAA